MQKIFSIVIPLYNSEKHISKCLDSIFLQKFDRPYEVIVVNDGSMDNSLNILKTYEEKYPNYIKIINQENQGVTKAREKGIRMADGKYILFVDSDDEMLPKSLYNFYEVIRNNNNTDIVIGGIIINKKNKTINKIIYNNDEINKEDYLSALFTRKFHWGPVARLFNKSLFSSETFTIPKELITGEDAIMNKNLALKANKILIIDKVFYKYNLHPDSTMAFKFKRRTEERLLLFSSEMRKYVPKELSNKLKSELLFFDFYSYIFYSKHGVRINKAKEWENQLYENIKKMKPKFMTFKYKILLFFFKTQFGKNLYYYLSSIYRMLVTKL